MGFHHEKREVAKYGRSPGNGTTEMPLSKNPLATEGEATPGPDDTNPYDEREHEIAKQAQEPTRQSAPDVSFGPPSDASPTAGRDPFVFDNVNPGVESVDLPGPEPEAPTLDFF